MTQPPPDEFAAPAHSTVASARPTAPMLGGATGVHPETFARALANGVPPRPPDASHPLAAELRRRAEQARRRIVRIAGSAQAVAGQTTLVLCGGPRLGFQWELRRLNIGPMNYSAGAYPTGVFIAALITVQEEPGNPTNDASRVVSTTTSYPAEGTWGRGEATLIGGDHLRVLITGLPDGVYVTVGGQAEEAAIDTLTSYGL